MNSKIAYIDAQAGVSGDMILGALVGLGLAPSFFEGVATALGLHGVEVRAESVRRSGIQGWQVTVVAGVQQPHRHLEEIEEQIGASTLPAEVRARSLAVFRLLAAAEARVHGVDAGHVHFHEVGAVDSLVDVVGAVAGLHALGVGEVTASALPLAPGTVSFSHGTHVLPAPAVAELVQGMLVCGLETRGETVTPTGAALVRTLATAQGPIPAMRVVGHGRGAGRRDDPRLANLLRIFLGERPAATDGAAAPGPRPSDSLLVVATVDDMSPQLFPAAFEQLFAAGAVDVCVTPILMKKARPGHRIEALCPPETEAAVVEALLRHSTTLGCRVVPVRKHTLDRRETTVRTAYGDVPVKEALLRGEVLRRKPEHEVVAALARQHGVSVEQVQDAVAATPRAAAEGTPAPPSPEPRTDD